MNGTNDNYHPSADLPMPNHEVVNPIGAEHMPNSPKKPEATTPGSMPPAALPPISSPLPRPVSSAGPTVSAPIPIQVNVAPQIADDSDLIEKEWVNKAKYIVEKTRNDPHLLNKEMNKIKADYIQKRYNKQLKVDQE